MRLAFDLSGYPIYVITNVHGCFKIGVVMFVIQAEICASQFRVSPAPCPQNTPKLNPSPQTNTTSILY